MNENPLKLLMNPQSIAIAGANNNPVKMGTMHALSILEDGFKGKFYPIHPKEETVLGHKAYQTPLDLPEAPDLAILVVPSHAVPELLEGFGKIGTRRAIIISAGFKEVGPEGVNLEKRILDIAAKYDIRFVGPNCMGIINSEISLNTTVILLEPGPGLLGFASQSGTYVTQSLAYLRKKGIRFSKAISVGNEANISIVDVLEYLGDDEQTQAISLYIEGIRDIPRFLDVARKITPRKPVIAQYIGGTEAGARSGKSHTGAIAGPDFLYDGLFKQAGIIRVESVEELYRYGWTLAAQPPLQGDRVGIITNSGGPGSAIANVCERGGFKVPPFSPELQKKMKPLIPPHAPSGNPVDMTFDLNADNFAVKLPELVMKSGEVDGIVLHGAMFEGFMNESYPHLKKVVGDVPLKEILKAFQSDMETPGKLPYTYKIPFVVSSFFDTDDNYTRMYQKNNISVFDSPEKAAKALVVLLKYRNVRERGSYTPPVLPKRSNTAAEIIAQALSEKKTALDEHSSKMLLKEYGIPVTEEHLAGSEQEAVACAEKAGYPVVMKPSSSEILHKSEKGLVKLNLKSKKEAITAYNDIQKGAGTQVPVIIYHMVEGVREFVAGFTRNDSFGPAVMFGLGGIFTEALKDASFRFAPVSIKEAEEMLFDIRAKALLGEVRGLPAVDTGSLAELVSRLSAVPILHPEIKEIDCNPVIIEGARPIVVDALISL